MLIQPQTNSIIRSNVKTNNLIVIRNVNGFTKGNMAKSRYVNSWTFLKNKIKFKCNEYGVSYKEVSEYLTTQDCNVCDSIEGPKGPKEQGVRFWECSCGAGLSRDINAAINILNIGRSVSPPSMGILTLKGEEDSIDSSTPQSYYILRGHNSTHVQNLFKGYL